MSSSKKDAIGIPESQLVDDLPSFTSKTPQKRPHILRPDRVSKCTVDLDVKVATEAKKSARLHDKYEMLARFFDSLDSSYRLLRMKGSLSNFTNISKKIECLTDRRFSYVHLAQMKYIFPDVIEMKKVLVFDENTKCMKPDLHISMNTDSLGSNASNLSLRKVFRNRLYDFYKDHPEGDDVPEEELPEPFNRSKHLEAPEIGTRHSPNPFIVKKVKREEEYTAADATNIPLSFRPHFSKHLPRDKVQSILKKIKAAEETEFTSSPPLSVQVTPEKVVLSREDCFAASHKKSSPGNLISSPKLMSVTPANKPPKRRCTSPSHFAEFSETKLVRRSLSLHFDSPTEEETFRRPSTPEIDLQDVLSEGLLQSIRGKEEKIMKERVPEVIEAKRRQQVIANLPKFFDMLYFLFQSMNCSVLEKDTVIHTLTTTSVDVLDRGEVEEMLKLLGEVEPEWVYEKLMPNGKLLLCINKGCSANSIRERLTKAR